MVIKIKEELDANENRQILILSDRKQQLEDFDKLLKESGVESVGYYVGGMKKNDLKKSESCRVLLGTYPMANEGLDIPSLNGLVLATPKSDIIQTVGRICRMKHENIQPLIIDLVDNFSVFEKQGKKRLDLYRKNKYEVEDLKFDMDKNQIFERKKYHYHNINLNCDTMKNKSAMGDKDISNYLDCVGRGGNKKDDKKEDLFNMFDDVF
jgi:superfamily II DNA or RNA helicase